MNYSAILTQRLQWHLVPSAIVYLESSKVELSSQYSSEMKGKLLQHNWSHFLRDLLNRCLQFYSHLCHHARRFSTVASPQNFKPFKRRKRRKKTQKRHACRWRMETCSNAYQKGSKYCDIKTYRKLLRSIYCKSQALFLCCIHSGLAKKDPGLHMLPNFNNRKSWLSLLYFILQLYYAPWVSALVSSHIWSMACGSKSIWKEDIGFHKDCFLSSALKGLISSQTAIMLLHRSLAPLLLMDGLRAGSSSKSQTFEEHKEPFSWT